MRTNWPWNWRLYLKQSRWCWSEHWWPVSVTRRADQPRQHIKKQRHYFVNKGPSSQGYGFPSGHVWMWELDCKESWAPKNWCFWTVVLEKTLESPLDCKEIKPVHPKGNQSWIFIGRTDVEAESPILWHLMWGADSFEKTLMLYWLLSSEQLNPTFGYMMGFEDEVLLRVRTGVPSAGFFDSRRLLFLVSTVPPLDHVEGCILSFI